jgi:molybdenum cofactor synthesis domain-containing protein
MPDASAGDIVTAAVLVIGDEILSGRTKDKNIGYIAEYLTDIGVDLREVRVVPDVEEEIVAAVNALRARYSHVFTTGGIGPTHDDITAESIAKAFGVPTEINEEAKALLMQRIPQMNEARLRMARMPVGAELIENAVSRAPGFSIGNVHVMAGVPGIMQAMLDALTPRLKTGRKILSRSIAAGLKEGDVGTPLGAIQAEFPDVKIGSYPTYDEKAGFTTTLVLRSRDAARLEAAATAINGMLAQVRASMSRQ